MNSLRKIFSGLSKARIKLMLLALWKLMRHPETPRSVKIVAVLVLAYALSPIDLIPDFIPVLGYLDDFILVPLGIALVIKLTPSHLWQARMEEAQASVERLPRVMWGALIIIAIWLLVLGAAVWWLLGLVTQAA